MAKKIKEQLDYGNRPERMDPNLERKLASPEGLYAQNPAMKKKEGDVQRLVSNKLIEKKGHGTVKNENAHKCFAAVWGKI